jgi:ParB family transcriptional regulator, chromosome partitioning protein
VSVVELQDIPLDAIIPSPYQVRKHFAPTSIAELATSIARDSLVEPIVVRRRGEQFELIAGERRWWAVKMLASREMILARIVEADDLQARRMLAAENLQRQDLSPIETVEAIVDMVDAELLEDEQYLSFGDEPLRRVKFLLMKLDSDRRNRTNHFTNKFIGKTQRIFQNLPKPQEWSSFLNNDLTLITTIDPEVKQVAIEHKLNKSQTKELGKLKEDAPQVYQTMTSRPQRRPRPRTAPTRFS